MNKGSLGRQQHIEDLFEEVRGLSVEEREQRLAATDVSDDIRAEVRSLLAFDADTVASTRAPHEAFDPASCLGLTVEGFVIRAVLGSGGMGTVFEAEQERPQRSVALKVLGAAGSKPSVSRRFLRESDFLARLDHPGIARVITAGALRLPDGTDRPYFAMELVAGGRPITRWARESGASLDQVLQVFAEACDAVGAGHRAGVAHLDLKPGNVLVGADGRARIIDYGIARSMGEAGGEHEGDRGVIGTPQYMSPEQFARGTQHVDSRADVYALGLMLYEVATGRLPYETRGLSIKRVAQLVTEVQPTPPRLVDANVPRALDAIIQRAIARTPDARYGTASELADDIRRFLADEPVVAARSTPIEDALRFVRKRRLLSASVLLALVATIAAIGITSRLAVTSRDAAVRSAKAASMANLRAAAACLREGDPAEGARLLKRVRGEDRGWEARHIDASIARYELLAPIGSEILQLSAANDTGEIACGISNGFVLIVDPAKPESYEIHDLRDTFEESTYRHFPTIRISQDGRRVLAPNALGKMLYLDRDVGSWRELPVSGVWSGFGREMVIAAGGGEITTIRPDGDKPLATAAQPANPMAMSISRDGVFAAVLCADGVVAQYAIDPESGAITERWRTSSIVRRPRAIAATDDGSSVFVVSRDGEIIRLDGVDGSIARRTELDGGAVFALVASRDGRTLAASSWTNVIRVIDAESLAIRDWVGGTLGHVWGIDFMPGDTHVAGRVLVVPPDATTERPLIEWLGVYRLDQEGATDDISIGRDVSAAVPHIEDGRTWFVDVEGTLCTVAVDDGAVENIGTVGGAARILRRHGESFFVGWLDGTVARFDRDAMGALVERWRRIATLSSVTALEVSPDGRSIACGGRERVCVLLDAETGEPRWRRDLPPGSSGDDRRFVSSFVFLDDGATMIPFSTDGGGRLPILAVADGRETEVLSTMAIEVDGVASADDGRLFGLGVTGSLLGYRADRNIATRELARNGGMIVPMRGQGRLLVAARDGLLRVVAVDPDVPDDGDADLDGIEDILRLNLPPGTPVALGFDPARDEVAVLTNRGRLRVWSGTADERSLPQPGLGQLEILIRDEVARAPRKPR